MTDGPVGGKGQSGPAAPAAPAAPDPSARPDDMALAREYGERAARMSEWLPMGWDDVEWSLARGWASRHAEVCGCVRDWRLSLQGVEAGWKAIRGRA